uniref:Claudin 34 n=1 Tax=Paramormyrops kingsleyae TaxID=1676925 RepID=A0A3B3QGQ4_9TELE
MAYLVHTAHLQFAGLLLGFVSWILTAVSMGLVQWRVWHVLDVTNITSGVAWVGIWRVCFPSRALVSSELQVLYCRSIPFRDPSTPPEVSVAQVLVPVALMVGGGGNACAVYGLRSVYFGMERMKPLRAAFSVAGVLSLLSAVCTMLPLAWNMRSVAANYTIDFPPDFHMPPSPVRQDVGAGLSLGMLASILTVLTFCFVCGDYIYIHSTCSNFPAVKGIFYRLLFLLLYITYFGLSIRPTCPRCIESTIK